MNLLIKNGILPSSIESEILDLTNGKLIENSDTIFKYFSKNGIPKYLINRLVYKLLAKKELNKALELAKFQAYYFPSDPNCWDTLGEVYYFLGDTILADKYYKDAKKIDSKFAGGGEKQWKIDLENHKLMWEKLKD
jgi:tetratricopeptide (TPR) repeat protein